MDDNLCFDWSVKDQINFGHFMIDCLNLNAMSQ